MTNARRCSKCFTVFPLNNENYYFDSHKGDFCSSCKFCKRKQSRKSYFKKRNPAPVVEDIRLLQSNQKALERLLSVFYEKGKASAPLMLEGASEPLKEGIQLFSLEDGGRVKFTTVSGTQTRKLTLISVEALAITLSSYDMRVIYE